MGATVKIKVARARNLPVMDRTSGLTDAYVEIIFGPKVECKTGVCKKTLNPSWEQDFRLEVPNVSYIQDNIILLKVWDYDFVSAGTVQLKKRNN
jgi:Ca2+-dependent lipid-binding protein